MLQRVTVPPRPQYALAELNHRRFSGGHHGRKSTRSAGDRVNRCQSRVWFTLNAMDGKLPDLRLPIYVLFLLGGLLKSRSIPIGALILILIAARIGVWHSGESIFTHG